MSKQKGLIYLFKGEGKGKTSAALGVTVRALLQDWRVSWVAFIKEESWPMSEKGLREQFANLEMHFVGKGFYIKGTKDKSERIKTRKVVGGVVVDKSDKDEHQKSAEEGLRLVVRQLEEGKYDLVVMDEVLNAVSEGLVREEMVVEAMKKRGKTHLVLTGRGESKVIEQAADLVTECRKVKHPYDKGIGAVKGLDW